jgi:hypothetical protein
VTLTKWLIYTVLLALAPVIIRLLVALITTGGGVPWIDSSDVISFGLTLAITNISGLESSTKIARDWKTTQIGISLLNVSLFAAMFALHCAASIPGSKMSSGRLLFGSVVLALAGVVHSRTIWQRLSVIRSRMQS